MTDSGEKELEVFKNLLEEEIGFSEIKELPAAHPSSYEPNFFKEKTTERPNGTVYEYLSRNIYICYVQLTEETDKSVLIPPFPGFLKCHFCLEGKNTIYLYPEKTPFLVIESQQHNMVYSGNNFLKILPDKTRKLEALVIYVRAAFFVDYLRPDSQTFLRFYEKVKKNTATVLYDRNLPIQTKIRNALLHLLYNKPKSTLCNPFMEGKVMEILIWQMEEAYNYHNIAETSLKEEEVNKMKEVRNILVSKLNEKLTLKELSHGVGTNEFDLKRNFKILFGQSVFGYQTQYKMQLAKSLLAQKKWKIADIASKLGYKYPTHFSAAFKKHFGYLPHEFLEKEDLD